jgi:uncharacterized protein DUF1329
MFTARSIRNCNALLLALAFLVTCTHSFAEVLPGDLITPVNAAKVKELVSPGVYYKVVNGMSMKIALTERIEWPPPYMNATEKYSGQVRLSQDGRSLVGYVAGQPFPFIDANDPQAATKIMWNNAFRPITSDDYDLRNYGCESVYTARGSAPRVIDHFQIGHYAGYALVGRTEVEPMPFDPDFKKTGRYWLFGLYPILEPQSLHGSGFIRWRYADPNRGDDSWSWTTGSRRVRRLNESILSSAVAPANGRSASMTTFDPDHYSGFNPKVEQYDYKFLGERTMLAPVNIANSPALQCKSDGGASACPENWQKRHLYLVEATPRPGYAGQALHGKTVVYIDAQLWFNPYVDSYDASGHLWQNHIYWMTYRDRPVPDARIAIYPFKREFVVGAAATDVQTGAATMCYLPDRNSPERETWYINMGAVDREFFTTNAMVRAAQ